MNNNHKLFFALLRAGLWEIPPRPLAFDKIDVRDIYRLAEEQAVEGLIAAGLEHIKEVKFPKEDILTFIGQALQLEQRNQAMNNFISLIVDKMSHADIYTLLIKGQGIAQCYERPLWRACGDIDFFLSDTNYSKALSFLTPLACSSRAEGDLGTHQELIIDSWIVELHGDLSCGLSQRIDNVLCEIQRDVFYGGNVRSWMNGKTTVFLPGVDNDVIIVFTHIVKHLFKGGIGLRQICDWARLLWKYRDEINVSLLKKRLCNAGLMTEWKAFAAFAVEYLGMPKETMPMHDTSAKWKKKADRLLSFVLESGNFGHNRDVGYQAEYSGFVRKIITWWKQVKDSIKLSLVFPLDSFRFLISFTVLKTKKSLK